ncbi:MAG: peptidylprolyl isomerase, partial [Ktedonobacterales bacterium]
TSTARPRRVPALLRRGMIRLALALGVGLALIPALAGCAPSANNDPVLAMRVGGAPVTLSAYQQILALFTASSALQTDASSAPVGWADPSDRTMVATARDQTVKFFINTLLLKTQLDKQHLTVTQKDIDVAVATLNSEIANARSQLAQTPGNGRLRQLVNSATPDAVRWLALQQAYTTVFLAKGQVPTAKVGGILVKTQTDANTIYGQLQGGAVFAALAKAKSLDTSSGANGGELGTIYVGQFVTAFDQEVFSARNVARYIVVPFQGSYGVFEIHSRGQSLLSAAGNTQSEQNYLNAWIDTVLTPQVSIEKYVGA